VDNKLQKINGLLKEEAESIIGSVEVYDNIIFFRGTGLYLALKTYGYLRQGHSIIYTIFKENEIEESIDRLKNLILYFLKTRNRWEEVYFYESSASDATSAYFCLDQYPGNMMFSLQVDGSLNDYFVSILKELNRLKIIEFSSSEERRGSIKPDEFIKILCFLLRKLKKFKINREKQLCCIIDDIKKPLDIEEIKKATESGVISKKCLNDII